MNAPVPAFIDDVPAQPASEQRSRERRDSGGCSEATVACCALAMSMDPLAGADVSASCTEALVKETIQANGRDRVLRWRQWTFTEQLEIRWAAARRTIRRDLPELHGAGELPPRHEDAGLPEIPSARCT